MHRSRARIVTLLAPCLVACLGGCATVLSPEYGIREGKLTPCPATRDCVSSQDPNSDRRVQPFTVSTDRREARDDLMRAMLHFEGVRIVSAHRNYLRAEFPATSINSEGYDVGGSMAMDDVEFYIPPDGSVYHVRSASRIGSPSIGENRKRVEALRRYFYQHQENLESGNE